MELHLGMNAVWASVIDVFRLYRALGYDLPEDKLKYSQDMAVAGVWKYRFYCFRVG